MSRLVAAGARHVAVAKVSVRFLQAVKRTVKSSARKPLYMQRLRFGRPKQSRVLCFVNGQNTRVRKPLRVQRLVVSDGPGSLKVVRVQRLANLCVKWTCKANTNNAETSTYKPFGGRGGSTMRARHTSRR